MLKFLFTFLLSILVCGCTSSYSRPESDPVLVSPVTGKQDSYYEAIRQYSILYAADKNDLTALLGLARNLRYTGQVEKALQYLQQAEGRFGGYPAFLIEKGKAHLAAGEFKAAKALLVEAAEKDSSYWDAYSALGVVYDFLGKYGKASQAYAYALEACPNSASILNNAGISTILAGDAKGGLTLLSTASQLRPYSKQIENNLQLFNKILLNCPACTAEEIRREIGATIAAQDWFNGDLACAVDAGQIIEALSHADYIDIQVEFAFDKATLLPEARSTLDGLGFALASQQLQDFSFRLEGHTDAVGTETYNQELSERRADAVREYLVNMLGIDPKRLETIGYGETRLLNEENPKSKDNRRVRIVRIK